MQIACIPNQAPQMADTPKSITTDSGGLTKWHKTKTSGDWFTEVRCAKPIKHGHTSMRRSWAYPEGA